MGISSPWCLKVGLLPPSHQADAVRFEASPCATPAREHLSRRSGKFRINDGPKKARAVPELSARGTRLLLTCWCCESCRILKNDPVANPSGAGSCQRDHRGCPTDDNPGRLRPSFLPRRLHCARNRKLRETETSSQKSRHSPARLRKRGGFGEMLRAEPVMRLWI